MKEEYAKTFTEVSEIIKLMPLELTNKIPNDFCQMIEEEKDNNYFPNIKEPIEKCKFKDETIIILGLIHRDFLCMPDERKKLQEKDAKEFQKIQLIVEQELKNKYNADEIFNNKKTFVNDEIVKNTDHSNLMVVKEEKWYKKIFNIIKSYFVK